MTRKNKNIIVVCIIFVLLVCLGLTIHFSKVVDHDNIMPINNNKAMDRYQYNDRNDVNKRDIPRDRNNNKNDSNEDNKQSDTKTSTEDSNIQLTLLKNTKQNDFGMYDIPNYQMTRNNNAMPIKSVVLIAIETFLLGGSMMFLIMNNIDRNIENIEATVIEEKKNMNRK